MWRRAAAARRGGSRRSGSDCGRSGRTASAERSGVAQWKRDGHARSVCTQVMCYRCPFAIVWQCEICAADVKLSGIWYSINDLICGVTALLTASERTAVCITGFKHVAITIDQTVLPSTTWVVHEQEKGSASTATIREHFQVCERSE